MRPDLSSAFPIFDIPETLLTTPIIQHLKFLTGPTRPGGANLTPLTNPHLPPLPNTPTPSHLHPAFTGPQQPQSLILTTRFNPPSPILRLPKIAYKLTHSDLITPFAKDVNNDLNIVKSNSIIANA
jgi:hypothetical protein